MPDLSHLDKKYFIDGTVYNCPFCNRNHIRYRVVGAFAFDWTSDKRCFGFLTRCDSCGNDALHLSYEKVFEEAPYSTSLKISPDCADDLDARVFYSVPTSFSVMDKRIPRALRELVAEADGCLKMNYLTGASACLRKAIYEFLVVEKAEGDRYEDRIKSLKGRYPWIDSGYFDALAQITDMTSDKVHELSWEKWTGPMVRLLVDTLKSVLYEVYVLPREKADRASLIQQLREAMAKDTKGRK